MLKTRVDASSASTSMPIIVPGAGPTSNVLPVIYTSLLALPVLVVPTDWTLTPCDLRRRKLLLVTLTIALGCTDVVPVVMICKPPWPLLEDWVSRYVELLVLSSRLPVVFLISTVDPPENEKSLLSSVTVPINSRILIAPSSEGM